MNEIAKKYVDAVALCNGAHEKKAVAGWSAIYRYGNSKDDDALDATVYRKGNRIVIAFAGTEMLSINDVKNDIDVFRSKLLPQLDTALNLYSYIASRPENRNCKIEFTGYSLGGTISNLMSHKTGLPSTAIAPIGSKHIANTYKQNFTYDDSKIITFGREKDVLFNNALLKGRQSGQVYLLPNVTIFNQLNPPYQNHELSRFENSDVLKAKKYISSPINY